jgi:hypothetical protein
LKKIIYRGILKIGGKYMEEIFELLNEYYLYVIGVGLVLIFILIGFLSSKKTGNKKDENAKEEPMANINEVKTGEINQVAENLEQEKIEPVNIEAMPTSDALFVDEGPVVPVIGEVQPVPGAADNQPETSEEIRFVTPNKPEDAEVPVDNATANSELFAGIDATNEVETAIPRPEETMVPDEIERFNKTEVIDFSNIDLGQPTEVKPTAPDYVSYVPEGSQPDVADNILNGEETNLNDEQQNRI